MDGGGITLKVMGKVGGLDPFNAHMPLVNTGLMGWYGPSRGSNILLRH